MTRLARGEWIDIHYRRLPDREHVFWQRVVEDDGHCVVTLLDAAELPRPVRAGGEIVLDPGAPVVWFTFRGLRHDIGRFHRADGTYTGLYANVLTPVEMDGATWRTTDLCLDVWTGADGGVEILDEDELMEAERMGWTDAATASLARSEARELAAASAAGAWPPPVVHEWTLERARAALLPLNDRATDA
ncbi:MAG TPA: DUF402 domain-containing protein [Longimicrobium sp.]